jgi:DNA polymerase III sliding clamp (beta) subunit (PCNA family)
MDKKLLAALELAVSFAANKKDSRYYLQDVLVKNVGGDCHIVATNGHTLVKITLRSYNSTLPERIDAISIKKAASFKDISLALESTLGGSYPEYERLFPSFETTVTLPLINIKYLAESCTALVKFNRRLHGSKFCALDFTQLSETGSNVFTYKSSDEDLSIQFIIMPVRK